MGRSGNIGNPRLYLCKCWAHNTALYVKHFYGSNPIWVFYLLKNLNYDEFVEGSAVPTLNRNYVHSFEIFIPPSELQNDFSDKVLKMLKLIKHNNDEISTLGKINDTVLSLLSR